MKISSAKLLLLGAACCLQAGEVSAQVAFDGDVARIDNPQASRHASRSGEVIVKFKAGSGVAMRAPQRAKFRTSRVGAVDKLFAEIGVAEVEELMPLTGSQSHPRLAKAANGKTIEAPAMNKVYLLRLKEDAAANPHEAIEKLREAADVEFAEPNYIVHSLAKESQPDDPYYSLQWGIQDINLPALWGEPVISKEGPVIAILDTGVDIMHPDLQANIWVNEKENAGANGYDDDRNGFTDDVHGWDFVNQTGVIADYNGHGTHCAGIAAACGFNGIGIIGANPHARIMPLTVLQSNGQGDIATIIKAVDYATANGADILSMSLGTYAESMALEQALARAYQKAVLVAAAGNDGLCLNHAHPEKGQIYPAPMFPAAYTFVLGVQASAQGGLASFSNYDDDGPTYSPYSEEKLYNYEITAPGASIMSCYPNGQYRSLNGTSMATPLVAGAISRLLQSKEVTNKEELFGDLINSHTDKGILDIHAAFLMNDNTRTPSLQIIADGMKDADGDGRPDAGEIIEFYPVVRNSWGTARNIKLSLDCAEEANTFCEFLNTDADFGQNLSSYGKAPSLNPLRIRIKDDVVDGRICRLKFTATCDNAAPIEQEFTIAVENGVEIGGVIEGEVTLHAGVHYIVTKTLAVAQNATLTIEPGAVLKFRSDAGISVANGTSIERTETIDNKRYDMIIYPNAGKIIAKGTPSNLITFTHTDFSSHNAFFEFGYNSELDYCLFSNLYSIDTTESYTSTDTPSYKRQYGTGYCKNSIFTGTTYQVHAIKTHNYFLNIVANTNGGHKLHGIHYSNVIGNISVAESYSDITGDAIKSVTSNYFGNRTKSTTGASTGNLYSVIISQQEPTIIKLEKPSYFGSARHDILKDWIIDINKGFGNGQLDLSTVATRPVAEAHGIVWKVVVDGYDAQDEFEMLPPLGVGKHKFEVYFNRPMNKEKAPMIAMGVRAPYTQTAIAEDGAWNEAGDIYTAYLTISGKQNIDGLNRIYVAQAEDDEFFEIPVENFRFNVNVQAAGSLSEGFTAEAGLGRVNLTWENPEENIDDMLGYNLYRYHIGENNLPGDTICINRQLIEPQKTAFTDYDVTTGTTYCYYYKVMRTSMTELDPSKTVAATPQTSVAGDANGSAVVDVADVVTTVNYASGMNPKPFIFEAADMNADKEINILDVVGIIHTILNPGVAEGASIESAVEFSVEDGVIYIDTPVEIAGVQVNVKLPRDSKVTALEALTGFEHTGAWIADDEYLFMAYNMSGKTIPAGKHAILNIADGAIASMTLSDAAGHNIAALPRDLSGIADPTAAGWEAPANVRGIYNVMGVKLSDNAADLRSLPAGIYIVNGQKIVK